MHCTIKTFQNITCLESMCNANAQALTTPNSSFWDLGNENQGAKLGIMRKKSTEIGNKPYVKDCLRFFKEGERGEKYVNITAFSCLDMSNN